MFQNVSMGSPLKSTVESVGKLPFWRLFVLTLQLFSILLGAAFAPLLLRSLVLPTLADYEHPLNFVFTTCQDQLSGVCSYPEARFFLNEADVNFAPETPYSLALDVELSPIEQNRNLGVFLVALQVQNKNGEQLVSYQRSTYFKDPNKHSAWSIYRLARNTFFFPLYVIGYFDAPETGHIHVEFTKNFVDKAANAASLILIQIQNRFVHVDSAKLSVTAHFGMLRYFLYQWPLISYCAVFVASFLFLLSFLLLAKAYFYVLAVVNTEPQQQQQQEEDELLDTEIEEEEVKSKPKSPRIQQNHHSEPLTEHDTPKFPIWKDIPGIEPPKMPPRPVEIVGITQNGDANALRQRKFNYIN